MEIRIKGMYFFFGEDAENEVFDVWVPNFLWFHNRNFGFSLFPIKRSFEFSIEPFGWQNKRFVLSIKVFSLFFDFKDWSDKS